MQLPVPLTLLLHYTDRKMPCASRTLGKNSLDMRMRPAR